MSHITIVINRTVPPSQADAAEDTQADAISSVHVEFVVPHGMSDADVGQAVKRLYKQVRDLSA